ncbi:hypothetical protein HS5_03010 [Acidianus sp. HS-5]|nr:hypothetical protein HS5_03010 [Acidianus sp. HS-5]
MLLTQEVRARDTSTHVYDPATGKTCESGMVKEFKIEVAAEILEVLKGPFTVTMVVFDSWSEKLLKGSF